MTVKGATTLPRSGRGGARTGTVGKAYSNRSDLNGSKTPMAHFTGQQYGTAVAQEASQRAVPAGTPAVATAPVNPDMAAQQWGGSVDLSGVPGLMDPTQRPAEPITHGLSQGPGAGPEVLPIATDGPDGQSVDVLRKLYAQTGSPMIRQLLAAWDGEQ